MNDEKLADKFDTADKSKQDAVVNETIERLDAKYVCKICSPRILTNANDKKLAD
jgi:hypothetical protein